MFAIMYSTIRKDELHAGTTLHRMMQGGPEYKTPRVGVFSDIHRISTRQNL